MQGKIVYSFTIPKTLSNNTFSRVWDCRDENENSLNPGIYNARYTSGNQAVTRKIIIN